MFVKDSYRDRVFIIEVVVYLGMVYIDEDKDFFSVIEKVFEFGGYREDVYMIGINGGDILIIGFVRGIVLFV